VKRLTEEAFCRLCSQKAVLVLDHERPPLTPRAEGLVNKSREAALAAVQHYNNPTAMFRSGNYIVLMVIAYTSLFHAIFERDGVDYIARDKNGNPKTITGGGTMLWDVLGIEDHYEKGHLTPMAANLRLLVPIRHQIEHQFMPELDATISGHCQSLLTNFEQLLTKEFGTFYSLNASLALALQFSTECTPESVKAVKRLQSAEYEALRSYIGQYEASLPPEILNDPAFAFRAWIIPKTANNPRTADAHLEYVNLETCSPEVRAELQKHIVAVKTQIREAQDAEHLLPSQVCERVAEAIGRKFTPTPHHERAWKKHKVRPPSKAEDKAKTDPKYCVWNAAFKQYVYTPAWVKFLIGEYSDQAAYLTLCGRAAREAEEGIV
jgi:hypothetical protein